MENKISEIIKQLNDEYEFFVLSKIKADILKELFLEVGSTCQKP